MTDGERLVWAASFALALERVGGDAISASFIAATAIARLREAAVRPLADRSLTSAQIDERDFIDEMVSTP